MQLDKLAGQGVELCLLLAGRAIVLAEELPDVEERHDQEVECIQARLLDRKAPVAISGIPALNLDTDLGNLAFQLILWPHFASLVSLFIKFHHAVKSW